MVYGNEKILKDVRPLEQGDSGGLVEKITLRIRKYDFSDVKKREFDGTNSLSFALIFH